MRGGAQSHLVEGDDGAYYVVKFSNNPQHRRILVNELVASVLLAHVGITCAKWALIEATPAFLEQSPDLYFQAGSSRLPAAPGIHFGSKHPGNPAELAVFDFVPDTLLGQVHNAAEFAGVLAFDQWVANTDARQAIFFRAPLREWDGAAQPGKKGFLAMMIDHGFAFNGPHWEFPEQPAQGLYHRRCVYHRVRSFDDLQPWLDRIVNAPDALFDDALKYVPPDWISGDEAAFEAVLDRLHRRRSRVPDLVDRCRRSNPTAFPQWT